MKIKVKNIMLHVVIIFITLISITPFWIMINMGTYKSTDLYKGIKLLPGNYLINNFKSLMQIDFLKYYANSLIVSLSCAVITVFVCAMCGYALSKYSFKAKKTMIFLVLLTMMIPNQLSLVGFVIEMKKIGWLNTLLPLIIPPSASAFGVFWMRQYSRDTIPTSVLESARIDGCSEIKVFFNIALPFMWPACMTLALLSFLWSWNSFVTPMVVLTNESLYTVPLGIRQLATQFRTDIGAQILGLTLATIPMLIFFSFFSKYLISGLASAAVKE